MPLKYAVGGSFEAESYDGMPLYEAGYCFSALVRELESELASGISKATDAKATDKGWQATPSMPSVLSDMNARLPILNAAMPDLTELLEPVSTMAKAISNINVSMVNGRALYERYVRPALQVVKDAYEAKSGGTETFTYTHHSASDTVAVTIEHIESKVHATRRIYISECLKGASPEYSKDWQVQTYLLNVVNEMYEGSYQQEISDTLESFRLLADDSAKPVAGMELEAAQKIRVMRISEDGDDISMAERKEIKRAIPRKVGGSKKRCPIHKDTEMTYVPERGLWKCFNEKGCNQISRPKVDLNDGVAIGKGALDIRVAVTHPGDAAQQAVFIMARNNVCVDVTDFLSQMNISQRAQRAINEARSGEASADVVCEEEIIITLRVPRLVVMSDGKAADKQ